MQNLDRYKNLVLELSGYKRRIECDYYIACIPLYTVVVENGGRQEM